MPTKTQTQQHTKLEPIDCGRDYGNVMEAAFDGVRKRPIVAINKAGDRVVCCLRTAQKNGWKIEGRLFSKGGEFHKAEAAPKEAVKAPAKKPAKQLKRRTDDTLKEQLRPVVDALLS